MKRKEGGTLSVVELQQVTDVNIPDASIVYSTSWQASHKGIVSDEYLATHTPKFKMKFLDEEIDSSCTEVYLLRDNNIPVGIISLNVEIGEIKSIYIAPEFWGKGYGKYMLNFAVSRLNRFQTIFLIVMNKNSGARKFYENYGFVYSGDEKILSIETGLSEMKYFYITK